MEPPPDHRPGLHLLVDLHGGPHLADPARIEAALRDAAAAARATVVASHFHAFPSTGGVTGMLLLAESHISVHTWPEHGYAAVDIFMCGAADAEAAMAVVARALGAERVAVTRALRGAAHSNQRSQPAL